MSAILFNKNSELFPVTKQKLVNLRETLKQDKLTPWLWFNSRGVNVTKFYGKPISISGGGYNDSTANVFFDFIKPFLEDSIVKNLDETLETCRARGLTPEEPYIRETAMLLDGYLIDPIYRYMADIDQRIRGKGNPKNVRRKDVTNEIAEMVRFLDKCKDEMIHGIKADGKTRVKLIENKPFYQKEDVNVLKAIDEWKITVQPHIEDLGISDVSPDTYALTQKIVTWCDEHSNIDAGVLLEVYRQIVACRKPEPEGYIGSHKSPEIMQETYRRAIDVCDRIVGLIKNKSGKVGDAGGGKTGSRSTDSQNKHEDIVELKPNFFGIGLNINALIRKRKWGIKIKNLLKAFIYRILRPK